MPINKAKKLVACCALFIACSNPALAGSGFDFYFFGQNMNAFQNSSWMQVAAGAVASVCVHELGHALYLQSIGKSWDLRSSLSSGFAVHTDDNLGRNQLSNFGRAGFALQTLIGTGLSMFEATRYSDFTKGWVAINAVEVLSYKGRRHEVGDDFELIERGGGNSDLELAAFSFLSFNNMMRLENGLLPFMAKTPAATPIDFARYNLPIKHDVGKIVPVTDDSPASLDIAANYKLPDFDPQKSLVPTNFQTRNSKFAGAESVPSDDSPDRVEAGHAWPDFDETFWAQTRTQ